MRSNFSLFKTVLNFVQGFFLFCFSFFFSSCSYLELFQHFPFLKRALPGCLTLGKKKHFSFFFKPPLPALNHFLHGCAYTLLSLYTSVLVPLSDIVSTFDSFECFRSEKPLPFQNTSVKTKSPIREAPGRKEHVSRRPFLRSGRDGGHERRVGRRAVTRLCPATHPSQHDGLSSRNW